MSTSPNENSRYVYEPLLDRWCVYSVSEHGQRNAVCGAYTEQTANAIVILLNGSTLTVNDTLDLADARLSALLPGPDCDSRDFAEYARGVQACRDELQKMRV